MLAATLLLAAALQPLNAIPQPVVIDNAAPLANTRYAVQAGKPLLASNGNDIFLFWATPDNIRVTRSGESRSSGRPVLSTNGYTSASIEHDVVWTGTEFLVAATRRNADGTTSIVGRRLRADGEPLGSEFAILANASDPRLAFNGTHFMLSFRAPNDTIMTRRLTREGVAVNELPAFATSMADIHDVASSGSSSLMLTVSRDQLELTPADANGIARPTQRVAGADLSTIRDARAAAVAGGGDGYFVVWRDSRFQLFGAFVDANGDRQSMVTIDREASTGMIALTATSSGYAVVYSRAYEVRMAQVSRDGTVTRSILDSPWVPPQVAVAAAGAKTLAAWTDYDGTIRTSGGAEALSYGAERQLLEATASSGDTVLSVWREGRWLRAGVRTNAGDWREHEIGFDPSNSLPNDESRPPVPYATKAIAAAAGIGQYAVLVETIGGGHAVFRLSGTGAFQGMTFIDGMNPQAIVWDGTRYVIAGIGLEDLQVPTESIAAMTLSPSGQLSAKSIVSFSGTHVVDVELARSGSEYLFAWRANSADGCVDPCNIDPLATDIEAVRVRADLTRIDNTPMVIVQSVRISDFTGVAWNGSQYVVAWTETNGLKYRTVTTGAVSGTWVLTVNPVSASHIAAMPFGVAITWRENDTDYAFVSDRDIRKLEWRGATTTRTHAAALGGGVAFIGSAVQDAPPYYGASRVMLAIDDIGLPPPPNQSFLTARLLPGARVQLAWNTPPQPPTNGYRVEMRPAGGTWSEVEAWLDAEERALIVQLPTTGIYNFRVRAWNDSGVSEYSNLETVSYGGRRRAVR